MSTNTKRLLIILGVAFVVCIVGAAVAIGGMGLLADRFKDNITMDSKKVRTMANEFISYELPDGYSEQMGMDFLVYKMVILGSDFKSSSSGSAIILTHFQATQGMTPEEMTEQMQKSFEQQSSQKGMKYEFVESRTVTIKGEETTLNVNQGTDSSGDTVTQWIANFPGKNGGIVILMIQGPSDTWDEAVLNDFLASIK
jgi:hypothetical protein